MISETNASIHFTFVIIGIHFELITKVSSKRKKPIWFHSSHSFLFDLKRWCQWMFLEKSVKSKSQHINANCRPNLQSSARISRQSLVSHDITVLMKALAFVRQKKHSNMLLYKLWHTEFVHYFTRLYFLDTDERIIGSVFHRRNRIEYWKHNECFQFFSQFSLVIHEKMKSLMKYVTSF